MQIMNEHLFKLKKDDKTVGYLKLAAGWTQFQILGRNDWYYPCDMKWTSAHPFVTKDKNGKDVFGDDPVWLHWKGKKTKGEIIKEGLFWKYKSHEGYSRTLCKFDISHIELIEDKEDD